MTQLKDAVFQGVGKLMQSDQAMKLLQNEAVMKAITKAFTVSTEARTMVDQQVAGMVKSLKLVTRDELKALPNAAALHARLQAALGGWKPEG